MTSSIWNVFWKWKKKVKFLKLVLNVATTLWSLGPNKSTESFTKIPTERGIDYMYKGIKIKFKKTWHQASWSASAMFYHYIAFPPSWCLLCGFLSTSTLLSPLKQWRRVEVILLPPVLAFFITNFLISLRHPLAQRSRGKGRWSRRRDRSNHPVMLKTALLYKLQRNLQYSQWYLRYSG